MVTISEDFDTNCEFLQTATDSIFSFTGYSPVCPPCDHEMKTDAILEHMCASEFGRNINTCITHWQIQKHTCMLLCTYTLHVPTQQPIFPSHVLYSAFPREPKLTFISLREQANSILNLLTYFLNLPNIPVQMAEEIAWFEGFIYRFNFSWTLLSLFSVHLV